MWASKSIGQINNSFRAGIIGTFRLLPLGLGQLFLAKHPSVDPHPSEIMAQFMDNRQTDLFADFGFARGDRLNVLLIKHDVIGACR